MLNTRARAALIGIAVFVAAMLGGAQSAWAAIYRGSWDPIYGSPFPNLGWKGTATFFIPDACLTGTALVSNGAACSLGGMKMLGATVSFYNATTNPLGDVILETLTFSPPDPYVYSMQVTNNVLTGVDSAYSNPVQAFSSLAGGGTSFFALQFFSSPADNSVVLYHMPGNIDPSCAYRGTRNYQASCGFNDQSKPPTMTLTLVPEPATFVLVLAGLGAIGLTMRRLRV